jgi:hypothetical protein
LTELLDVRTVDASLDIPHIDVVDVQSCEVGVRRLYRVRRKRVMNVVHTRFVPPGIQRKNPVADTHSTSRKRRNERPGISVAGLGVGLDYRVDGQ